MKKIIFCLLITFPAISFAQLNLVPMPAEIKIGQGSFSISNKTTIYYSDQNIKMIAKQVKDYLQKKHGISVPVKYLPEELIESKDDGISLILFPKLVKADPIAGSYVLNVTKKSINVVSMEEEGLFYGIQTLLQLLPPKPENFNSLNYHFSIPQLSIKDYPRFSYRGMHLDVARHFEPVSFIKKYIDYLAAYKFNTFHLHLTDDQGWRIEIKKYPKLTQVGGYRNGTIIGRYPGTGNDSTYYGGFYTQEEIKEVVQYAAERYIDVIPEIEMPGHASAAIAAYPQLSCFPEEDTQVPPGTAWAGSRSGKKVQQTWGVFEDVFTPTDYTFKFLEDVLDEVMPLFPSRYIHIGGDECPKEAWKKSAFCQQLIKDNNLKDEHGLQSYFIQRIEKYINSKGKKIIGWDEILEGGLAPNAAVMSWRGEEGGIAAAKLKHDVVMTPGEWVYFDHSQSSNEDSVTIGGYTPVEKVYGYEPIPAALSKENEKYVLGAQANVWTEYIKNPSKIEYMIFPRMAALSEVLWSPKEKRNWKDFERRLPLIFARLNEQKINYSTGYYNIKDSIYSENGKILWALKSNMKSQINAAADGNLDEIEKLNYESILQVYKMPIEVKKSGIGIAVLYNSVNRKTLGPLKRKFSFNKATGKKITIKNEPGKGYSGDGAFTLVNAVQNEKGLSKASEFLGFSGKDCEGQIDFGRPEKIKTIRFHSLNQSGSWIYPPKYIEVSFGNAATGKKKFSPDKSIVDKQGNTTYEIKLDDAVTASLLNFKMVNFGIIPEGSPGAGTAAWLFVDEIEVE
jgi:hexosaminidase